MYIPKEFKEIRTDEINRIIQTFPLACIVANTEQGLIAVHIPLIAKDNGILLGHLALENDMVDLLADGQDVLCIFKGDDAYISANYYPSKFEDHKKVPTWNYQVVHVYGNIIFHHDNKSKLAALGQLTKVQELKTNGDAAWKMSDAPKDYLYEMMEHLIAFEIKITRVLAKSKLSQNQDKKDFVNVIKELKAHGHTALAESMSQWDKENLDESIK